MNFDARDEKSLCLADLPPFWYDDRMVEIRFATEPPERATVGGRPEWLARVPLCREGRWFRRRLAEAGGRLR
jgi:hypothetical protein